MPWPYYITLTYCVCTYKAPAHVEVTNAKENDPLCQTYAKISIQTSWLSPGTRRERRFGINAPETGHMTSVMAAILACVGSSGSRLCFLLSRQISEMSKTQCLKASHHVIHGMKQTASIKGRNYRS